jgi:hypothetical protein
VTPLVSEIYIDDIKQDLIVKQFYYNTENDRVFLHLETPANSKRKRITQGVLMEDPKNKDRFVLVAYLEDQDKFTIMRNLDLNSGETAEDYTGD